MEKIQELTEKLYREGVEKGEAEAARLVGEAREEAGKLLAGAREEADKLLAEARKKAKETEDNTRSELKLAAGQALEALKSEVTDMISARLASNAATELTAEKDFMGRFVVAMAGNWAADGGMTVSTPEADALTAYVRENAKKLLAGGLKIEKVAGRRASFSIAPADGGYRVDFGPEEFAAYFKDFLRPRLVEMLFEPRS